MDSKNIKKEYTSDEVTVVWQLGKCIQSAMCVKTSREFFNLKLQPEALFISFWK